MAVHVFLVQEFHDISPPVDYSLIPTWLVFVCAFFALAVIGLIIWQIVRWRRRRPQHIETSRERALKLLELARVEIARTTPYEFSIRVSDILRRYVTEQYHLPLTRQTSVEFLEALARTSSFSADERSLLGDFLNRCDLIKFARYDATTADSESLLEEATRFVKGGELAPA
ncbi:MAG: DUF4381 domain-containing protein [Verrucomicrobiota bacterium]|nr:DUF4381 domain-containing protein [Verrucomicrobiota bacterium]